MFSKKDAHTYINQLLNFPSCKATSREGLLKSRVENRTLKVEKQGTTIVFAYVNEDNDNKGIKKIMQ